MNLTQEKLKGLLNYNPDTGIFTWKVATNNRIRVGEVAGSIDANRYRRIRIEGVKYLEHRLAFLYMLGTVPDNVDHIDQDRSNNKWPNLRVCSLSENQHNRAININSTSCLKGISFNQQCRGSKVYLKVIAQIKLNSRRHSKTIYYSTDKEKQVAIDTLTNWIRDKREELHGDFYNNG
jgi:hypothetical protein